MIRFLIFMSKSTLLIFSIFRHFCIKYLRQKRHLSNMFSRKCQVQNDRTNREKISCFRQKLDFTLYFTIKTSIFKLWPLFRFLCLINSFYRRYVSCMYNISNISNKYQIYQIKQINPTDTSISNFFRAVPVTEAHGKHKTLMSRRHIYIYIYCIYMYLCIAFLRFVM